MSEYLTIGMFQGIDLMSLLIQHTQGELAGSLGFPMKFPVT